MVELINGASLKGDLIAQALAVETPEQMDALAAELLSVAPYRRPVGDRWGNRSLFTAAGGNFDHKLTELVTNMHDAVLMGRLLDQRGATALASPNLFTAFSTPKHAVAELFHDEPFDSLANHSLVELHSAGSDRKRERTIVFRDRGIGMSPADVVNSLFRVGSSRKDGVLWQMGAFGRGGLTVLPNCHGLVIVTSDDSTDSGAAVITTVRWERIGNRQTETATYQVASAWETEGDEAWPAEVSKMGSGFGRGTHIAVVGFRAEGVWVSRLGDERSLDTVIDTRLFEAPLPTTLAAPVLGDRNRQTRLRGLGNRFANNPRSDRAEGRESLPFRFSTSTYLLPIRFYLFETGDKGARRRFVAKDHALVLNSNGQVHAHWTPQEFRNRTRLKKLSDRILVVVDTDPLPLELRTSLFTADRTELLRNPDAVRLEEEVISFLDDWDELNEANNEMIRQAIRRSNSDRPTFELSQKVARATDVRSPSRSSSPSTGRNPKPKPPRELFEDPTMLIGPASVRAKPGETKGAYFSLDAYDRFIPDRSNGSVDTDQFDIDPSTDITIGELKNGRIRVAIAVPPDAEPGAFLLTLTIPQWLTVSGALAGPLTAEAPFEIVDPKETPAQRSRSGRKKPSGGRVAPVAMAWTSHENEPDWTAATVGEIEALPGVDLAAMGAEYSEYAAIDGEVQLVKLNEEFAPLKAYASMRSRVVGDDGVARAKERYALGVAVDMLVAERGLERERSRSGDVSDELIADLTNAAARGVLAVLPDYDKLTAEVGLEDL